MSKSTDITIDSAKIHYLPAHTRMPLKFGGEVVEFIMCARVSVQVSDANGNHAEGWGETPLSVTWAWPSSLTYQERYDAMLNFCNELCVQWSRIELSGHPMEIGEEFLNNVMPAMLDAFNEKLTLGEELPHLAALICSSAFDIAVHDAYGMLHNVPVYETYNAQYMNKDLSQFITPLETTDVSFVGKYPEDFFREKRLETIPVWHLVGGVDPIDESELTGNEPDDGYPVLLEDWIKTDGLNCLKIKLRGNDSEWDYNRLVKIGQIAIKNNLDWLTTDFNCLVQDPQYVNIILDKLVEEHPRIYGMILYVEQPFPYDLEENKIDVHSTSARKPLFMDESAHDWKLIKLGYQLGWTGVALKTCKTQTGALLSLCWAKAHGMTLMVQDLTNPMLAQIPHLLLGAHAGTIMGIECNAMQFYPAISAPEAKVHPKAYVRRDGVLNIESIYGSGFGYRLAEMTRTVEEL